MSIRSCATVAKMRTRHCGDHQERKLKRADQDRRSLDAAIGAAQHDDQQSGGGKRKRQIARDAVEFADAGNGGELGDHRAGYRHRKQGCRDPRPTAAEAVADELAVPAASKDAEPHRQLLNHIENGDQAEQQRQQPVAPARSALSRCHHVAGIGISQHHQNAWPDVGNEHQKRPWPRYRVAPILQALVFPLRKRFRRRLDADKAACAGRSARAELVHGRLPALAKPVHDRVFLRQGLSDEHRSVDDAIRQDI